MIIEKSGGFAKNGYAALRGVVADPARTFLYQYALKSACSGQLPRNDPNVVDTPSYYADPFMESLLEMLRPRVEIESGLELCPTYSYFRVYKTGDVLKPHTDRPACEVSVTLSLGYEAREAWPIWLDLNGEPRSFALEPGDALLYRGIDLTHWRDGFPGTHSVQVFLHYVDQKGPWKLWKYDRRASLGIKPVIARLMEQYKPSLSVPANTALSLDLPRNETVP